MKINLIKKKEFAFCYRDNDIIYYYTMNPYIPSLYSTNVKDAHKAIENSEEYLEWIDDIERSERFDSSFFLKEI